MTHISSRLAVIVFLLCSSARCFAAPRVLSLRSIDLNGAVDDADISPDGKYLAAAVRVCKRLGQSRRNTCTHYIGVWSFGDTKLVANRTLFADVRGDVRVALRFSAEGRTLVISDGQGKLRVWQTSDLAETTSIDLGFVSDEVRQLEAQDAEEFARFREETKLAQPSPRVEQIAASPSSPFVAAVVRVGHWADVVQVFDLTSGRLLRSWSFLDAATHFGGPPLAWAQDGKRVAVSLPGTRGSKETRRPDPADLLIYDANSGQLTAKFETQEEKERNVLAGTRQGTAVFAGDEVIVSTRRFPGTFFRPTLRVFDSRTGQAIRTISAEGTGVRDPIAISADGRVLLGFVGRIRKVMVWSDLTSIDVSLDARIRLWEMPSGEVLSTSDALPIHPDTKPSFRLNATGNCIVAFGGIGGSKLVLLELK